MRGREWAKANPKAVAVSNRHSRLRLYYGITVETYEAMLENQKNKCAICEKDLAKKGSRSAHLDHCHKTRFVRGILCLKCNSALGLFEDDLEVMSKAIAYLVSRTTPEGFSFAPVRRYIPGVARTYSEEFRKAASERGKGNKGSRGGGSWNKGKKATDVTRKKISDGVRSVVWTPEMKKKRSEDGKIYAAKRWQKVG